jgi:hypothetical protein
MHHHHLRSRVLLSSAASLPWILLPFAAGCIGAGDPVAEVETAVSELGCTATKLEAFSSDADEGRLVFSPDGKLALFHRFVDGRLAIMESRRVAGAWTTPVVAGFSTDAWFDSDPFIGYDGKTVLFSSDRPRPGASDARPDTDLWQTKRTASGGWTAPTLLPDVNTDSMELFPSTTLDGTLYFNSQRPGAEAWDIFVAKRRHGGYHAPQRLPGDVNTAIWEFNPSPGPFGVLLAFASLDPDPAAPYSDVFFSVRIGGEYSERIAAGACVNTVEEEYHPTLDLARGRLVFVRNDPFSPSYPQGDLYEVPLTGVLADEAALAE